MNTNKIREALEYVRMRWDTHDGQVLEIGLIDEALAELDEQPSAEPVAQPYVVRRVDSQMATLWDIVGPTENDAWYPTEAAAERDARRLNAAYNANQPKP